MRRPLGQPDQNVGEMDHRIGQPAMQDGVPTYETLLLTGCFWLNESLRLIGGVGSRPADVAELFVGEPLSCACVLCLLAETSGLTW